MIESINPYDDKVIKQYEEMSRGETDEILSKSFKELIKWERISFGERSRLMKNAADILRNRKREYAVLMTKEMGKPLSQSEGEIEKCAWVCDYFAENAEGFLKEEIITTDASRSYITFQPLGIILAIMPWNFPFWQVFRFAAPNLMAGNGAVLKHASNVTGTALAIEEVFREAGFPEDLFRTIILSSKNMTNIIDHSKISAVTLTGSVSAGKKVAAAAGENLKKSVLELGGSDPYIILEDADLEAAAETCVASRLINGGQSCIAAKRFIVAERVYNKFEKLFVEKMSRKKMGNPMEDVDIGPLARKDLRDDLHELVMKSVEKGAELLLGGTVPGSRGAFYPPTVLANVKKGMSAYEEELFGPVAALIKVKDETEAVAAANDTSFGLGAAVFTKDIKAGEEIAARKLKAGSCFVNSYVKSDPRLPFGGIKDSGYGRELSIFGIREFVNIKTVYIK